MLLFALLACTTPEPRQPDVVLFLVDTLRADAMGYAGAEHPATPNFDQLVATEATAFTRAYSASSWTLASTATLFSGRYPWQHRVTRDRFERRHCYGRLPAHEPTLASRWKAKGYRTGAWINNAFLAPEFGLDSGFDTYDFHGAELTGHRTAAETVQAALAWLDEAPEQPALMVVHVMEPHADYDPGPPFAGRFTEGLEASISVPIGTNLHHGWMTGSLPSPDEKDQAFIRAAYAEEVLAADAAAGELIAGLQARGRWEDATFVMTSDHGEELWDLGRFEHGHSLASPVTGVPLLVKAPGVPAGINGSVVDATRAAELLHTGQGWVLDTAISGQEDSQAFALSEGILYGPQATSKVTRDRRVTLSLEQPQAKAWTLNEKGFEETIVAGPEAQALVDATVAQLAKGRGNLEPTRPIDPTAVMGAEVFYMLRQLGYVDAETRQQAPCE